MTSHFERLWGLGFRALIPIIPPGAPIHEKSSLHRRIAAGHDDRGKVPGVRGGDGLWRGFDWIPHVTDERDLQRWEAMGAGVGIKTGVDGVVLIDADTLNKEHAYAIKLAIEKHIGPTPIRIGRSPKAGYVIRVSEPVPYQRVEFGRNPETGKPERVEVLSGGRQFVAEGLHPSGSPYRWPVPLVELERLTTVSPRQLADLLADLRAILPDASPVVTEGVGSSDTPVSQDTLRGEPALVRRALASIPNTSEHFPTRESYVAIGYALKAALPDDEGGALELFAEWAGRWTDGENNPAIVEQDFRRMRPPFKRGASWLYELAENLGPKGAFTRAEQWFEPITALAEQELFPIQKKERRRLDLVSFADAADTALTLSAAPLIDGLMDQGAMTILYGESGAGKTFVALDMAYHVASGRDWGGMRATQMGVVYVAAEGGVGARKRAQALRLKFGPVDVPIAFILSPIDLLHADADTGPLIEAVRATNEAFLPKRLKIGLIVIDTFSRALAGGEENGSTDMGAIVANFDRIRHATGAHLLVVHHSGKDRAKGARGHSLLRAATDTEIEVAEKQITATKQRDLECAFATAFELDSVVLGENANGKPITSATVRLVARNAVEVGIASPREQDVLDAIVTLVALLPIEEQAKGVSTGAVAEFLESSESGMNAGAIRKHLGRLASKHLIVPSGRSRWRAQAEAPAHFVGIMG